MRLPALVVSLATVSLLLAGCSGGADQSTPGAPVGTLVVTGGSDVPGAATFVRLPSGRVDFTIGKPRQDLPAYDETYDHAADGASLVGVGWEWDYASAVPWMLDSTQPEPEPQISLVADGRAYPLDEAVLTRFDEDGADDPDARALQFRGAVYVAVEGTPRELAIQVDYDGLSQTVEPDDDSVRDEDSASPLYGDQTALAAQPVSCGGPVTPKASGLSLDAPDCQASVARLPYVQGVGWAPAGQSWVVVELTVSGGSVALWRRGDEQEVYTVDQRSVLNTVDGVEPVATISRSADYIDRLVFPATAAGRPLVVDADFTTSGYARSDAAPDNPTVSARWTIDLV